MSKRVFERKVGELEVLNLARQLTAYTCQVCINNNYFPLKYRWVITSKLTESAINAMISIRAANCISVQTKHDYELRRKEQLVAKSNLDSLIAMIELAYTMDFINDRKTEYWSSLCNNVTKKLAAWMKGDKQRYKEIIK